MKMLKRASISETRTLSL
jgi:hypothetical protein